MDIHGSSMDIHGSSMVIYGYPCIIDGIIQSAEITCPFANLTIVSNVL
jgi:hypothetical protein